MKFLLASTLAAVIGAASTAALAQTSGGGDASQLPCDIGYVTGVGGSVESLREYQATPERDKYRYVTDHDIQCQVSDEGRATACTGVTRLSHEKVSVYDTIDSKTMSVVARIELEHGQTYPVIIAVSRQDLRCEQ
ncbi:hypothetical protein [Paraburkholderia rhizosphaerae]|uniref:Uncharacterized protein n=1 Tax=Paraburkholderia rhizosphaerae TaxID=480658 RepID=A0A4R8LL50_9BURK|nr:hypothetical protein [Paraburkholderia rhizosphaerae]TDY43230.1 hypothetical protein BX592_11825 [Paraburkholderia rhizosphaerae]